MLGVIATGLIVDRWWWQVSLTMIQVLATIGGVYLAALIALRHDRTARLAEARRGGADALRPLVSRIGDSVEGVRRLGAEESVYELDADARQLRPPRERLRHDLGEAMQDCRAARTAHGHHLRDANLDCCKETHHTLSAGRGSGTWRLGAVVLPWHSSFLSSLSSGGGRRRRCRAACSWVVRNPAALGCPVLVLVVVVVYRDDGATAEDAGGVRGRKGLLWACPVGSRRLRMRALQREDDAAWIESGDGLSVMAGRMPAAA